jgi:hypothetical protein
MTDRAVPSGSRGGRLYRAVPFILVLAALAAIPAEASNATLRARLNTWSAKLGIDAKAVTAAAVARHPRRMTTAALVFRRDAVSAGAAIRSQSVTTTRARRAKTLGVAAFASYARAGTLWAASGRARLAHKLTLAVADARRAATLVKAGNAGLVSAGTLLR